MENLSESKLNEPQSASGTLIGNASDGRTNGGPEDAEFNFGITSANEQCDLGTLRPDKVMSFSHVRHASQEDNEGRSSAGSDKMIIKRTMEWNIQEEFE